MTYTVMLSQFEGPLDLLLHLISGAKIDIRDIFVSDITEQYLAFMSQAQELDMESASEFLAMAATLIEIKSRALLPKPPAPEPEEESPEDELVRRLMEYKAFKEAGARFALLQNEARAYLTRLPEELVDPQIEPNMRDLTVDALSRAFLKILSRASMQAQLPPPREIRRETFSMQECMLRIQSVLREKKQTSFSALFDENAQFDEVVSVFIALLELIRLERVSVLQEDTFGEIQLIARRKERTDAT